MASSLAPHVRLEFAKRLKVLRTQRGFPRARYFASTLGIEENRYTRYERAEVEPSLSLIHKICETLRVSPNELLGFEALPRDVAHGDGFAETGPADAAPGKVQGRDALAWSLASEIVTIRRESLGARTKSVDPLGDLKDTGAIYRSLLAEPFETVAGLAEDPALALAPAKRKGEIANLMSRFTASQQAMR